MDIYYFLTSKINPIHVYTLDFNFKIGIYYSLYSKICLTLLWFSTYYVDIYYSLISKCIFHTQNFLVYIKLVATILYLPKFISLYYLYYFLFYTYLEAILQLLNFISFFYTYSTHYTVSFLFTWYMHSWDPCVQTKKKIINRTQLS